MSSERDKLFNLLAASFPAHIGKLVLDELPAFRDLPESFKISHKESSQAMWVSKSDVFKDWDYWRGEIESFLATTVENPLNKFQSDYGLTDAEMIELCQRYLKAKAA